MSRLIGQTSAKRRLMKLKTRIVQRQKLIFLDYERRIYLRCDASKISCGEMLF